MERNNDFGLLFWLHLTLIILAYLSPFLFSWKLILAGALLIYLQQAIFQGCLLTQAQFGKDKDMTFYYHYLTLAGFKINKHKLKILMARIMPGLITLFALFWQLILKFVPLIN